MWKWIARRCKLGQVSADTSSRTPNQQKWTQSGAKCKKFPMLPRTHRCNAKNVYRDEVLFFRVCLCGSCSVSSFLSPPNCCVCVRKETFHLCIPVLGGRWRLQRCAEATENFQNIKTHTITITTKISEKLRQARRAKLKQYRKPIIFNGKKYFLFTAKFVLFLAFLGPLDGHSNMFPLLETNLTFWRSLRNWKRVLCLLPSDVHSQTE